MNSLNVLNDYFLANVKNCDCVLDEEFDILFGKINAGNFKLNNKLILLVIKLISLVFSLVRDCSEKLLQDLEKCWQENILLYGVCDIIQKHAQDNFHVYVDYCENQILLDATLKIMK